MTEEVQQFVETAAAAAADKKGENILALDMEGISDFTEAFLIISANSDPQIKALSASIREAMREKYDRKPFGEDGFPTSQWLVLDYGSLIIHIFHANKRELYALENLWRDAKRTEY